MTGIETIMGEAMITGWSFVPTGSGLLITTNWKLPDRGDIEIHVRRVGEREDLYLVTDGGELFNFFYLQGIDISRDRDAMDVVSRVAGDYGAKVVEGQVVKGANEGDFQEAVRSVLEALKEAAFILWGRGRLPRGDEDRR